MGVYIYIGDTSRPEPILGGFPRSEECLSVGFDMYSRTPEVATWLVSLVFRGFGFRAV